MQLRQNMEGRRPLQRRARRRGATRGDGGRLRWGAAEFRVFYVFRVFRFFRGALVCILLRTLAHLPRVGWIRGPFRTRLIAIR
jgi:hypothetical protein